jgi:hypothetical protein
MRSVRDFMVSRVLAEFSHSQGQSRPLRQSTTGQRADFCNTRQKIANWKEILADQESDRQPENDQPKDVKRFI